MGIVRMGWENLGMLWGPVCLLNVVTLRFEFSALKIDVEQQGSPKNVICFPSTDTSCSMVTREETKVSLEETVDFGVTV